MPTYLESQAVKDFRYNAYFGQNQIPKIDGASYKLNLSGLVDRRTPWTLQDLYQLPQESQVTRHVCVEGWSMIGIWTGVPFRTLLQRIGADLTAKYVGFTIVCFRILPGARNTWRTKRWSVPGELDLPVHVLPKWYDVDDIAGLKMLQAELFEGRSFAPEFCPAEPRYARALIQSLIETADLKERLAFNAFWRAVE